MLCELEVFVSSDAPAVVLSAPGGSGKSRVLLELARRVEQNDTRPPFRFVVPDAGWTGEDISDLPSAPLIIVIDDAHRRVDLGSLVEDCLGQNSSARFLLRAAQHLSMVCDTTSARLNVQMPPSRLLICLRWTTPRRSNLLPRSYRATRRILLTGWYKPRTTTPSLSLWAVGVSRNIR